MSRIQAAWNRLPAMARDLMILGTVAVGCFGAGIAFHDARDIPDKLRADLAATNRRVDTLTVRMDQHVNGYHAMIATQMAAFQAQLDSAQVDRKELFRLMSEAAGTRCWLVNKVAPNSIPPPECVPRRRR